MLAPLWCFIWPGAVCGAPGQNKAGITRTLSRQKPNKPRISLSLCCLVWPGLAHTPHVTPKRCPSQIYSCLIKNKCRLGCPSQIKGLCLLSFDPTFTYDAAPKVPSLCHRLTQKMTFPEIFLSLHLTWMNFQEAAFVYHHLTQILMQTKTYFLLSFDPTLTLTKTYFLPSLDPTFNP